MHHCLQNIFQRRPLLCSGIGLHGTCHPQLEHLFFFLLFYTRLSERTAWSTALPPGPQVV